MIDVASVPTIPFNQPDTVRLISTAYIDEPAMAPMADDQGELEFLEELEGLTSARRRGDVMLPPGVYPDELLTDRHGYGWSYVNAALNRDYSMMLGVTILIGVLTILFNLLADIVYAWLDPKIRY